MMTSLFALIGFAFVSSATPGPNNMMLLASGANFGFKRTLPHMLGISLGHMVMVLCMGFGLAQIFETYPMLKEIMTYASVAYLLWLAYKIANAAAPEAKGDTGKPFTFLQAAAFQWVNPKAWTMGISAITLYLPEQSARGVILTGIVFATVNMPSVSLWTVLGQQMARFLSTPKRLKAFNWTMALLLVLSLYPILL